jgi:TRL-like protein family
MKYMKTLLALGLITMVAGCAMGRAPVTGTLFSDVSGSESVSSNILGTKMGKACATSILGWVGTGDASAATAAKSGGISQISTVDYHTKSILGIWAESCTMVHGN